MDKPFWKGQEFYREISKGWQSLPQKAPTRFDPNYKCRKECLLRPIKILMIEDEFRETEAKGQRLKLADLTLPIVQAITGPRGVVIGMESDLRCAVRIESTEW